ncbi:MAG TPA: hypothetical protein VKK31_30695 [Thermoanaerobaculia bacterium]|nr:hypothetical protein [Thermoanaerobaculia bacterium]
MTKFRLPLLLLAAVLSFAASLSSPRPAFAACIYDHQCGLNGKCCCSQCVLRTAMCDPFDCGPEG